MTSKISSDKCIYLVTALVGLVGLIFYDIPEIMYGIIGLECIILIFLFLLQKSELYVCFLISFIVMSQEFSYFLGDNVTIYSFKETRVFGLNIGLIFTLLFLLKILLCENALNRVNRYSEGMKFVKWLCLLIILSALIGAFNILINNNNIALIPNVWHTYLGEISYGIYVLALGFIIIFIAENYGFTLLEKTLFAIMACNLILPLLANLVGIMGTYGGKELYLTLSAFMLCVFILIFPGYKKYESKSIKFYLLFLSGVLYPLIFKSIAFGKLIIIIIVSSLLFFYLKSRKNVLWVMISVGIIAMLFISWNIIIKTLIENNSLFGYKYRQVISLISFWNSGWYENMLPSPKVRITEIGNIFIELIQNPIYFLFGKGILGTAKDYLGQIAPFDLSVYSYNEFMIQAYYGMHETFNIFFLSNGILGLAFLFLYIKKVIMNLRKNPWILIGGVWLILLWGYSTTRATFGVASLCLGLIYIEQEKSN